MKEAGFPVVKTLETFQFAACVSMNEALVRLLTRGDYLEKKENILLVGNPGTVSLLLDRVAHSAL